MPNHEKSIGMRLVVLLVIVLGMSCLSGVSSSSRTNNLHVTMPKWTHKQPYDLVGWFKGTRSKAKHEKSIGMRLVVLFVIVLGMSCWEWVVAL
jgi:hypothetical protein